MAPFSVPGLRRTRTLDEHEQYHHDHDNNRGRADHDAPIATTPGHPIANAAAPSTLVAIFCACDASTRGRVWTASVISIQQADLQFGVARFGVQDCIQLSPTHYCPFINSQTDDLGERF